MSSYTIPYVVERTPAGERSFDIYSRLLQERIIFVGTEIDDGVANVVMAQLLHLADVGPDREVSLYVNSPGGSFTSLMAIYDTMQFVPTPVATYCLGQAASALLAAGEPGRRFALRHSRVLLHQPSTGGQGTVSDLALQADELLRVRSQVEEVDVSTDARLACALPAQASMKIEFRQCQALLAQTPGATFYQRLRDKFGRLSY